ncbi:hypothetical protein PpBr36_07869 [Pyricularia pennisetigena]|uniref:hypothetical protein n=1 Tax=Pyricularia pennisetigena TaxID=1578925 RepID=UPI00115362BF|nr:hypothetical protein PpBr36_07869 [Pyricularia pennisetigena]TLS24988.1 hypothetical protein PpBr36_07869 [Pyricularia pennisetigena]
MSGFVHDAIVRHAYGLDRRWNINPDQTPAILRTDRRPMREPATARWGLDISAAEPDGDRATFCTDGTGGARIESITSEQKLSETATARHTEKRAKTLAAYLCRNSCGMCAGEAACI